MLCLKGHHIQEEKGSRVRRVAAEPMPFECCLFLGDFFLKCGPFLQSLLDLLQYCFCCLHVGFLASRHVGSYFLNQGSNPHSCIGRHKNLTIGPPGTSLSTVFWSQWWPIRVGTENSFEGQWGQGGEVCRACWGWAWVPGYKLWPVWSLCFSL